jgi:tetratricopeptide (TPR) repeat protein
MSYAKKTTITVFLIIFINIILFHTVLAIENITKEIPQHDDIITYQNTTFSESTQNSSVENGNIIIETQRSFDRSLDILNIVATLIGVLVGLLTLIIIIATALGFFEYNKWRAIRKTIETEANVIRDIRTNAENDVSIFKEKFKNLFHLPITEKPSEELIEKSNELISRLELSEKLGTKLKPDDYYIRGVNLFYKGQYEEALKTFDKVIELKPDDADAWSNKGAALGKLDQYEEALKAYDKAIELKPDDADAWYNKGVALGEFDQYEEALKAYDKAIELKPDDADAWSNKGAVLGELDQYEEALKAYDKAIELKPDYADAWFNKGVVLG